jgi:hypothetical protein
LFNYWQLLATAHTALAAVLLLHARSGKGTMNKFETIFVRNWQLRLHNMPITERGGAGKTGKLENYSHMIKGGILWNSAPLPLIKPYRITLF